MTVEKMKNNDRDELIADYVNNISEGAKVFGETASDIFNSLLEKVRDTAETAYEKGSQFYEEVSLTAQDYVDRFRNRSEMVRLKEKRDEVAKELGNMCFMEFSGRYRFRVEFMKSDEFRKLISQVRELDKQIIRLGKKLDEKS
jgi:hypothetical protein